MIQQPRRHDRRQGERDEPGDEHRARQRQRKFAEERAGETALKRDGRIDRRERDGHGDDRSDEFARAQQRGIDGRLAFAHMPLDVFDHHDRVIHDETDRQHHRQQRQQIQREAEGLHEKNAAQERQRNRHQRNQHRAQRTEEQENHDGNNQQRFRQRLQNFVDRILDIFGRVVSHVPGEAGRQFVLDRGHFFADALDHFQRIGVGQHPDAHEHGAFAAEAHLAVVIFRAERHVGHVAQPDELVAVLPHHELFEFIHGTQIGVRRQIHLHQRTLRVADRREKIIGRKHLPDLIRIDAERRQPVGLQPDAHGECAAAQQVRALHAFERGEARLHNARQIIGDLIRLQQVRGKTQVGGGELRVGGLNVDCRHLGFRRQIVAHLVDLGIDFRQRLFAVVI